MDGTLQNDIPTLPNLDNTRYENIFKLYLAEKGADSSYYYYNIINKVSIPNDIDPNLVSHISLNRKLPWTTLSYKLYGTTHLWWLIFLLNTPKNVFYADAGITYKYFLPSYIDDVLNNIVSQVNA
jgi:hypothetical protein